MNNEIKYLVYAGFGCALFKPYIAACCWLYLMIFGG